MAFELTGEQKEAIEKSLGFLDIDPETKDLLRAIGLGITLFGTFLTLALTLDSIIDRFRRELEK